MVSWRVNSANWAMTLGRSTIRDVLKRRCVPPAPECGKHGNRWHTFLAHYYDDVVACDFFTVETAWLKTLYVLFFIELGSRRVHLAGCTSRPTSAWVTGDPPGVGASPQLEDSGRNTPRPLPHPRS